MISANAITWIISLLPGTAAVRQKGNQLTIHILDLHLPVHENLQELEKTNNASFKLIPGCSL